MEPTVRRPTPVSPQAGAAEVIPPVSTSEPQFRDRVAALSQDHAMRRLAVRYTRDPVLAEDVLQEACYAILHVRDPRIDNLHSYFRRVLRQKAVELLDLAGPLTVDDPDAILAAPPGRAQRPGTRRPVPWESPAADRAVRKAQLSAWLAELARPNAPVPGCSADPRRYRSVIANVARLVLPAFLEGEVSRSDMNQLLIQEYPQWFAAADSTLATYHQRLSRGRKAVLALLAAVVRREELTG